MGYLSTLRTINELAWGFYNSNPLNTPKRNMNPKEISSLLAGFNKQKVEFMVVGGFAMAFHGYPRATGDIDLWIKNTPENMMRLREALVQAGFPEAIGLRATTQLVPGMAIFNFADSDFKIDLMHNLKLFKETDFDSCLQRASVNRYDEVEIRVISAEDLLEEKSMTNRGKDLMDVDFLKEKVKGKAL
jgi:hypothetical protein